jgi:hypothetical protein
MAMEAIRQSLGDAETRAYASVVLVFFAGVTLQFLVRLQDDGGRMGPESLA